MKKIRNRVFALILVPTIVVYFVIIVGGLWVINRSFREEVLSQKNAELENASRGLDNWLTDRISHMIQLSRTTLLATDDHERAVRFLADERERLGFIYRSFSYVFRDGRSLNTDGSITILPDNHVLNTVFRENKAFLYEGPVIDDSLFENTILIAAPVRREGTIVALVAGAIPIETFRRLVGYFTIDSFASFVVVNARSTIITASDNSIVGLNEREYFGREFSANTVLETDLAFVSVLRSTWKVITFASKESVFVQVRNINRVAVLFFIAIILIIGISTYVISTAVVRPIRHLTEGVHRLMAGNYQQHFQVSTQDELKELADAFNLLSNRLAHQRRDDQFVFLGHFAARMAHEIRKPLHIAQLAAQALRSKRSFNKRHVSLIETEIKNADRFIGEILNFARPDQLNLISYSLPELIDKILRKYDLVFEEQGIDIRTDIDRGVPDIFIDIIKMEQAVSNLLQNAIDASSERGKPEDEKNRWVHVALKNDADSSITMVITDSGAGFDDETLQRAMDPYYTGKENGTGLGLSIAYRILTAHGATLVLSNTDDGHGKVSVDFSNWSES